MWSHPFLFFREETWKKKKNPSGSTIVLFTVAGKHFIWRKQHFFSSLTLGCTHWEDYSLVTWNATLTELAVCISRNSSHFSGGPQVLYKENSPILPIHKSETKGDQSRGSCGQGHPWGQWQRETCLCISWVSSSDILPSSPKSAERTWITWIDQLSTKSCI